jgi:putative transferase (TIGR04331 family)
MSLHVDKETSFKNIRATALKEFWGDEYDESIFLWQGSKHDLKFDEIVTSRTCKNVLSSVDEVKAGHEACVKLYYKVLPQVSRILNEVNGVNLSVKFWQIAFGYWLYRHICNVYEKHSRLARLDVKKTSLKLLDVKSFYIPHNHVDYLFCFSNDFGIEQLVSQYYNLKDLDKPSITKEYIPSDPQAVSDIDKKKYCIDLFKKIIKRYVLNSKKINPKVALLGVGFSKDNIDDLSKKSNGMIEPISLPIVFLKRDENDMVSRLKFSKISSESEFEEYLFNTLIYCIPKDYIENFNTYYRSFKKDLGKKAYRHIISEDWISNIPNAIYIGLAKEKGCNFISYEHGFGTYFYESDYDFICYDAADIYLSVGWEKKASNIVKGGFASRTIIPYKHGSGQNEILFISRTVLLYEVELIDRNMVDPHFLGDLKNIDNFIKLLPDKLKQSFVFRPRPPGQLCWDTVYQLDLKDRGINIDTENFSKSIQRSRIIVIDHLSTAIAEIILIGAPFIMLYDVKTVSINMGAFELFEEMIACGLLHLNSESAIDHVNIIYDDVQKWWTSPNVQMALNKLKDSSISPGSKTIDYLLSLIG